MSKIIPFPTRTPDAEIVRVKMEELLAYIERCCGNDKRSLRCLLVDIAESANNGGDAFGDSDPCYDLRMLDLAGAVASIISSGGEDTSTLCAEADKKYHKHHI